MGWAVGIRDGRHIGYGVPAKCDHPDCDVDIDRGLSFLCGEHPDADAGCGLFFCGKHLTYDVGTDDDGYVAVCERCAAMEPAFYPSPDVAEWVEHVLTDDSWARWRAEEPEWAERMLAVLDPVVWPPPPPPVSPTVDEALEHVRDYAAEQLAEAKAEYRLHAKQAWRDLGMQRPPDRQDYVDALATVRDALAPAMAHFKRVIQVNLNAVRTLAEQLKAAGVLDEHGNYTLDQGDTHT